MQKQINTTKSGYNRPVLLSGLTLALAVFVYLFNYRLPLAQENYSLKTSAAKLTQQVSVKAAEVRKLRATALLSEQDLQERTLEQNLVQTMPSPPMVYCPMKISGILRKYQIQQTNPTLTMVLPFRDHKTLIRQNWEFSLPQNGALPIGSAMAELENNFPLCQIRSFLFRKDDNQPGVDAEMVVQFAVYR